MAGETAKARNRRIEAAHRRASLAKRALGALAALAFGVAAVLARSTFAGRPKHPIHPLSAPRQFEQIVQQNLLQAGLLAPAQAPPGAATGVS